VKTKDSKKGCFDIFIQFQWTTLFIRVQRAILKMADIVQRERDPGVQTLGRKSRGKKR